MLAPSTLFERRPVSSLCIVSDPKSFSCCFRLLLLRVRLRSRLDLRHLRDRLDRSTNLEGADLTDTIVEGCQFGDGVGLSPLQKEYLKRRGGIFNDAPGDRSSVETPSPTRP